MEYEQKTLPITKLVSNSGQIAGLPKNPRFIRDDKFYKLKKSIEESPEMLKLRELLVYPYDGKYIVIGGNMRLKAAIDLGIAELPCKVLSTDTSVEKLKEYTIKDNNNYGDWDYSLLNDDWGTSPLDDWGLDMPMAEEEPDKEEKVVGAVPFTEVLNEEHNYIVLYFDNEVDWLQAETLFELQTVQSLSTRKDGKITAKRMGVGRVLNGAKALNKILNK